LPEKEFQLSKHIPGGAQDVWGIPWEKDPTGLKKGLKKFRLEGDVKRRKISCHELDAITCPTVTQEHHDSRSLILGNPDEGLMILPQRIS